MNAADLNMLMPAFLLVLVSISSTHSKRAKDPRDCEVCVSFLQKFVDSLDEDTKSSQPAVEESLINTCAKTKRKEERFCYYVGGLETSPLKILNDITKPITFHKPVQKICEALNKEDGQICELKYDKEIDLVKANFKKMKVKELKKILANWDEVCKGCAEKSDFIRRIEEVMPDHAPEQARLRAEAKAKSEL